MSKIVVIGAGVGGMTVAARLAKQGHNISIYEASDRTGGKCRTEWIGDYAFDTGPSLLTLPAIYKDFFIKTGPRFEKVLTIQPVNPSFTYNFVDGKSVDFINLDLPKTCAAIDQSLGVDAGNSWHSLMQRAEAMWDIARVPFIQSELRSIWGLLKRRDLLTGIRRIAPFKSLRTVTNQYTKDKHIQMITDRYATYTGSDPRKAPAALLTIPFVETSFGAWHLAGGIGQLSVALEDRCQLLGIPIHLNSRVTVINTNGDKISGITLDDGTIVEADIVIANADAEIVYNQLLDPNIRAARSERKKLKQSEKSLAGFSLLLGLDNSKITDPAPQLNHHTVFFPKNYDAEFDDIFTKKIPVTDPTIYICSPKDPLMVRRENTESWSILINAPRHDPGTGWDWSTGGTEYAQKIIEKLDSLGLKVSSRLDVMEFRTPLDLQNATSAPGGSIYGTSSNGAMSAFSKAKNRSPVKGLYCVGGSAHPGGGLPLVGMSAELVAEIIGATESGVSTAHHHH
ncbi:MAG: phytoene desaturase family protein [Actinomycetota bacterium]